MSSGTIADYPQAQGAWIINSRRREEIAMWTSFGTLSIVTWILFAQSSWNMDAVPVFSVAQLSSGASVEIRDRGEIFGPAAER